jgi:hypothetical protein
MADSSFLVYSPEEPLDSFNKRLEEASAGASVTMAEVFPFPNGFAVSLLAEVVEEEGKIVPAGPVLEPPKVLWMDEGEKIIDFNNRLIAACKEMDATAAVVYLVNDRPLVIIYCETVPQEEGKEEEEPELFSDPVVAAACKISWGTLKDASKTELYMEKIADLAMGAITDLQVVDHGSTVYALVVYALPPEEGEDGKEGDEGQGEDQDDSKPELEPVEVDKP